MKIETQDFTHSSVVKTPPFNAADPSSILDQRTNVPRALGCGQREVLVGDWTEGDPAGQAFPSLCLLPALTVGGVQAVLQSSLTTAPPRALILPAALTRLSLPE